MLRLYANDNRSVHGAMDHRGNLADFLSQSQEFIGQDGLHAVGKRVIGIVVDFHHDPIRAHGDCRAR